MKQHALHTPDEPYTRTKVALLHIITENVEKRLEKLPPESTLAAQLGVSRVLVRDIFGELESRGYITRKQGKGTVINAQVCLAQPRIDEQISFSDVIEAKQMTSTVRLLQDCWLQPEETTLEATANILVPGKQLLMMERVFCGDGKPMIHSRMYFRGDNIVFDYKKWSGYDKLSPSEFLEVFCANKATVTLAELGLQVADAKMAKKMNLPNNTTLFKMTDIRFDFDGQEIARGEALFRPEVLPLKLVRHGD